MRQDKIEESVLETQEHIILHKMRIEVLSQLLVEKGIIGPGEITDKENYLHKLQDIKTLWKNCINQRKS